MVLIEVYPRLKVRFHDDTDTDDEDSDSNESYEMYPRLKVRFYEDTDTDEEDSNSYESDESTIKCLSPVGLGQQSLKSPIKRGNNFENQLQNTSCSTPSKWFSKLHYVAFTSTTITTTEKAGNNIGDKVDRPDMFVRPRATVSSRDNDDLIALQNQRVEKKTSRVKKCYISLPPDRKDRFENKIVESVPVLATKSLAQVPSASKKKGEIRPVPVSATKSPAQVLAASKREEENRIKPVSATKVTNSPAQVSSAARRNEESRIVPVSATKVTNSPAQVSSAAKRNEESRIVPVSATKVTKSPAPVSSTAKRKENSGTRRTIA